MADAITTATQGLLSAQRRATDVASEILREASGLSSDTSFSEAVEAAQSSDDLNATGAVTEQSSGSPINAPDSGSLIAQLVELRSSQRAFEANAAAFQRASEVADEALGSLVDDEG